MLGEGTWPQKHDAEIRAGLHQRTPRTTTDKFVREDLKEIAAELRRTGRVDYARDNTREALAGRYVDQSAFRNHTSDCPSPLFSRT